MMMVVVRKRRMRRKRIKTRKKMIILKEPSTDQGWLFHKLSMHPAPYPDENTFFMVLN